MNSPSILTAQQVAAYHRDGYVILKNCLTPAEVAVLLPHVDIGKPGAGFGDAGGRKARLEFWTDTASTIWGAASTCPRIVNNVRILMGEEIAFFHGKVTLKEAQTGGSWEWHQDYGYWHDQGYVFPRMLSAFAALDPNSPANGCLQVLRGSHLLGRLTHQQVQGQTGVDPQRMAQLEPFFERVAVILEPGDVLFFHCNTLHTSGPNTSPRHRRNFIMCYNALGNPQLGAKKSSQQFPCPVGAADVIERVAAS